jgi:hypothetical protein
MTAERDGSRRCILNSYDKCPPNFHTDSDGEGIRCVSNYAASSQPGPTPGQTGTGGTGGRSDCPLQGFHMGKTAQGAERCIQNALATCPPGYTQQRMGRFYCISQYPVPPGQTCGSGGTMTAEKDGSRRCILANYDKCPAGFHIDMLPGEQFACVR